MLVCYIINIRILCVAIIHIVSSADAEANSSCPLWYWFNERSGHCECCTNKIIHYTEVVCPQTNKNYFEIFRGQCMTWNNVTKDVEVGRCLFI